MCPLPWPLVAVQAMSSRIDGGFGCPSGTASTKDSLGAIDSSCFSVNRDRPGDGASLLGICELSDPSNAQRPEFDRTSVILTMHQPNNTTKTAYDEWPPGRVIVNFCNIAWHNVSNTQPYRRGTGLRSFPLLRPERGAQPDCSSCWARRLLRARYDITAPTPLHPAARRGAARPAPRWPGRADRRWSRPAPPRAAQALEILARRGG